MDSEISDVPSESVDGGEKINTKANPLATILSLAMCLHYSFDQGALASQLEQAVQNVLNNGIRTGDIMAPGCTQVSTSAMGDALIGQLTQMKAKAA